MKHLPILAGLSSLPMYAQTNNDLDDFAWIEAAVLMLVIACVLAGLYLIWRGWYQRKLERERASAAFLTAVDDAAPTPIHRVHSIGAVYGSDPMVVFTPGGTYPVPVFVPTDIDPVSCSDPDPDAGCLDPVRQDIDAVVSDCSTPESPVDCSAPDPDPPSDN